MKNKNTIMLIILFVSIALLTSSCSTQSEKTINSAANVTSLLDVDAVVNHPQQHLPSEFTSTAIKDAFDEYINYQLWFYPDRVTGEKAGFDSYIGQTIHAEIRLYANHSEINKVYIHTSIGGELLTPCRVDHGIVNCGGQITKDDVEFPKGNYSVVDQFSIKVQKAHKPNYGTSPRKNKMIEAAENKIEATCKDLTSGSDGENWINANIYLVDFYEYEDIVQVWFIRQDGYIWNSPIQLIEKNGGFGTQGVKGYSLENVEKLDKYDFGRYMFDKQIADAIKQVQCTK